MILLYITFTCLAICTHGIKLHEHMTKKELQTIFNCDHDLVHEVEYEVTPIIHVDQLDKKGRRVPRSHSAAHFKAFDKNISLYLLQNDNTLLGNHTPLFIAKRNRYLRNYGHPQIIYSRTTFPMPKKLKLYHDMKNRAAVTVFTDEENKAHMHGLIGDNLIVKPIPARLQKEILPKYPELYQSSFSYKSQKSFSNPPFFSDPFTGNPLLGNFYEPTHHIVIKPKVKISSAHYVPMESRWKYSNEQWDNTDRGANHLKKLNLNWKHPMEKHWLWGSSTDSDTVYPELLVTVDYETYEINGKDINELSKYVAAFWNAVDLRFREMSQPQIRLNIAGLIVPQTRDSAPYFYEGRVNHKAIDIYKTIKEIQKYFFREKQFLKSMYDIAVAISYLDFGYLNDNGKFHDDITGLATFKGACQVQSGEAAIAIRDKGGFSGITTAAHELAHSMGAPHDGDESRDIPGGPCPPSDGYLMSYQRRDSRGVHWSQCSKTAMRMFLKSDDAKCLKNKPNIGTPYPKILPGKLLSRDEQCTRSFGPGWLSEAKKERNCAVLYCRKPVSSFQHRIMTQFKPPAEGSYCGKGAICLDAQCVKDPEVS